MHIFIAALFVISFTAFAKETVPVHAVKLEKMPSASIDAYNANHVLYNKELIQMQPQTQNVLETLNGSSSVEYQHNETDFGGHTGLSINQLPFYYTSYFIDGIYVPDSFIDKNQLFTANATEKVAVIKGGSSTKAMPSSLSGAVDISTKNILLNGSERSLQVTSGNYGFTKVDFLESKKLDDNSGFLVSATFNKRTHVDDNKDGIAESPKMKNFSSTIAHQLKKNGIEVKTRLDVLQNERFGGATNVDKNSTTGNPFDFSKTGSPNPNGWRESDGTVVNWNDGAAGLLETLQSRRAALISSVKSKNYTGGAMASFLQRDNFYSGNVYEADETNFFATLAKKFKAKNIRANLGGDFHYQKLNSAVINNTSRLNNPDAYTHSIAAVFGAAEYEKGKTNINLAARVMNHNEFDFFHTLKGALQYRHNKNFTSAITAGNSYYVPSSSIEQDHELIEEDLETFTRNVTDPTENLNFSYSATYSNKTFQATLGYNYNRLKNVSALEIDEADAEFKTLNGKYKVQGIGLDVSYFISPTLLWNFAAERYWHDLSNLEEGYLITARPEYKLFTSITKKVKQSSFRLKATYFGRYNLEKFYHETYNLAGEENDKYSPTFLLLDFNAQHKLNKHIKLFFGIENITDYVQIEKSPQLALEQHNHGGTTEEHLHNTYAWGPARGRFFYIGVKWTK